MHASDGLHAYEIVKKDVKFNLNNYCSFDLILMDCNMPRMDGYDSTEAIRKFILANQIPQPIICATTGHIEPIYVKKCFESGMNAVYSKPVEKTLL